MKLDMEAIRKRLGEAVVFSGPNGLGIGIETDDGLYFDLVSSEIRHIMPLLPTIDNWQIRPGDRCKGSDDGNHWHEGVFMKFDLKHSDEPFSIQIDGYVQHTNWTYIRPRRPRHRKRLSCRTVLRKWNVTSQR